MKVSRRIKKYIWVSFSALYLSGTAYWLTRVFLRRAGQFGDEPNPLEKALGPAHVLAAFGFLFAMGLIWDHHIRAAIHAGKHRFSGWAFNSILPLLMLSGTAMLYGSEDLIRFAEKWHPWAGTALLPLLVWHGWKKARVGKAGSTSRRTVSARR